MRELLLCSVTRINQSINQSTMIYFIDSPSITTEDLVLIVVGSVSAVAVVTGIIVCVLYTYSRQKR
jgi:hypothetical protein